MNSAFRLFSFGWLLLVSASAMAAGLPREIVEAETKYGKAVQSLLEKAGDDLDARKKLAALNESFLKHLRGISPKLLARDPDCGTILSERVELMKWKTSFSQEITVLDARKALGELSEKAGAMKVAVVKAATDPAAPQGELECREADGSVAIGDSFEIKGKTKNIPDGHVVQVFAMPSFKAMFPREERKIPNKKFAVGETVGEVWVGPMEFYLMSLPEAVMDEVDLFIVARRRWEEGGFKSDEVPKFKAKPTKNLYLDKLEEHGAIKLAAIKMTYVR